MAGNGDSDSHSHSHSGGEDNSSALPTLAPLVMTPSTDDVEAKTGSVSTSRSKLWSAREAKLGAIAAMKPLPAARSTSATPKSSTRTVFGKFRRSSAGSKAELPPDVHETPSRRSSASLEHQEAITPDNMKVDKSKSDAQSDPARSSSVSGNDAGDVVETGKDIVEAGGDFVDDVREKLERLLVQLDSVDARKLVAVRLGGELRGLLGKAQDEFTAYETEFLEHAGGDGVSVALRNFAASLEQVGPIAERLRGAKFLLNKKFKREVLFAFQEINSYYTSLFVELSMAVAKRSGLALPLPLPEPVELPPPLPTPESEPVEESAPSADTLCLEAHAHFFGHGAPRDLRKALELYQQAADLGSSRAMTCLGQMYAGGLGAEKDLLVAEKWLHLATSAGELEACHQLSRLLCEKATHEKSPHKTEELLSLSRVRCSQAAEQGHCEAQYDLGEFHERGRGGCVPDEIQAAVWYLKAAEQGHTQAEASLGRLLLEGAQTEPDTAKAVHFLQRAAAKDNASAQMRLGVLYTTGDGVKADLDRGVAFLRKAANAGDCEAMTRLAKLLLLHSPSSKETESARTSTPLSFCEQFEDREEAHDEALRLLLNAGNGGHPEAQFTLGELLEKSSFLRDRAAALRFYIKAATAVPHHTKAAKRVAAMYYSGIGCSVDKWKSHRFYSIAAHAGDAEALNALGLMFEEGEGCDLNYLKAAECYRGAVELESPHAHFNLGCLLSHGKGVERNVDAAQAHFHQAAALGYTLAQQFVVK